MRRSWFAILLAGWVFLGFPVVLDSCAIGSSSPIFATATRPADIAGEFLRGKLGVLRSSLEPIYLIGAFRIMSGEPLSEAEIESLYPPTPDRDGRYQLSPNQAGNRTSSWEWRRQVLSAEPAKHVEIQPYKRMPVAGSVSSFLNCNEDAFETAGATLMGLQAEWGLKDERLLSWVLAQDQVFSNCSAAEPNIPIAPGPGMDPLLAAHRRYQIAAAQFYAGEFREAAAGFLRIAKEDDSPWQTIAPYLAARALIRAVQFAGDATAYGEAKAILEADFQDSTTELWHSTGQGLLARMKLRMEPETRVAELDAILMGHRDEDVRQAAIDFEFLMQRSLDYRGASLTEADRLRLEAASELAAWLTTFTRGHSGRGERAVAWWRKTGNPAWLIAALAAAPDRDVPELLTAASKVVPNAPAFDSVTYYAILREVKRGRREHARAWADRALARGNMVRSARNLILAERTKLARNWDEFLSYGLRKPEPLIGFFDGREDPNIRVPLPGGSVSRLRLRCCERRQFGNPTSSLDRCQP